MIIIQYIKNFVRSIVKTNASISACTLTTAWLTLYPHTFTVNDMVFPTTWGSSQCHLTTQNCEARDKAELLKSSFQSQFFPSPEAGTEVTVPDAPGMRMCLKSRAMFRIQSMTITTHRTAIPNPSVSTKKGEQFIKVKQKITKCWGGMPHYNHII